jgi:ribosomal protection tetracycline resistance protein
MRTLKRLSIPTVIFVNKIDRMGAKDEGVLQAISEKLTPSIVELGSAQQLGTRGASSALYEASDAAFRARLADRLADHNDALLAAFVNDETTVSYRRLREELAMQTKQALLYPVFFGSAITGAGVDALTEGITELLPSAEGDLDGDASGAVFKVERGPAGEKIAYVRMFAGEVRIRDQLRFGRGHEGKVTAIRVFDRGSTHQRATVGAGQIGKLWGLGEIQIGDAIGVSEATSERHYFAPPTMETVVVPDRASDKGALHLALTQLAEQDPLINLRQDDVRQELFVSLYGEVQKEVIQATLANDFGIDVGFSETTTICIERPVGIGAAVELKGEASNPFPLGAVGLRVEPAPTDTGVGYRREGEVLGRMPPAFFKAVEETVHETLLQGLYGWLVTDCVITMTHAGYTARHSHAHQKFNKSMSSTAGDFRNLTPLVLMTALKQAGTQVYEPVHRFHLEVPADALGPVLPALTRLGAIPNSPMMRGSTCLLDGEIPAARVDELQQQLPALTRGEGVLEYAFDRYQPVRGTTPTRPRSDHNPLNRKEYLLHVVRRV